MSDTEHALRVALLNAADRVRILHEGLLEAARQRDDARNEIERLNARVAVLEKHLGLMIVNNLTGSCESEGMATDRAIAVLPDWLEKANGYTRAELDAADENMKLHVEEAKP